MEKRITGIVIFVLLGLFLGIFHPFAPELPAVGHWCIGGLLVAVALWVFAPKWVPLSVGAVLMMMISLGAGSKYSAVFSGYTSAAIWILIPALYFGFALTKTGLGKRLAYGIIGIFKPTYLTLTISWLIIGLVLSALTPSITVRVAIVIPIAATTVEICHLTGRSRGASYILLVAWAMAMIPGTGWLNGALWGPIGKGFFDATPELANMITFESWSQAILLPSELIAVFFIIGLYLIMKPEEPLDIKVDTFRAAYADLGSMSFQEKATLSILSLTFIMFATGRVHHIPDAAICLGSFALLVIFRVIEMRDISSGINWDLILFVGSVFGLGSVFIESGVSSFLVGAYSSVIANLSISPWLFIYLMVIVLFVWRFVDVAQLNPTIPMIIPAFPLIAEKFGINPLVSFCLCTMAGNCFFISYQQPFVILAESIGGNVIWSPDQLAKAGTIYFVACMVALAISIPYWMGIGLIG